MNENRLKMIAEKAQIKHRSAYCPGCAAEESGAKYRVAQEHTCERGEHYGPTLGDVGIHGLSGDQLFTPLREERGRGEAAKTIYIAGKVTGLPYAEVKAKFAAAQFQLESAGWHVINPCLLCAQDATHNEAMRICLAALCQCDALYLLPCWPTSKGAHMEARMAFDLGIEIIDGF